MSKKIIAYVQTQMFSDECSSNDNTRIQNSYDSSSPEVKKVIDDIFISLCGYSLETVIREADEDDDCE